MRLIRRVLGLDRAEAVEFEERDRSDALRSASRAKRLARRLRGEAQEGEIRLRVEVLRRPR